MMAHAGVGTSHGMEGALLGVGVSVDDHGVHVCLQSDMLRGTRA